MKVRFAVIPCAGLGTRMLPASAMYPKELLPIGNVPVLHFVLSEVARAGVETVVLVNSPRKPALDNYMSQVGFLEQQESKPPVEKAVSQLRSLSDRLDLVSVRQDESLGLGHAIGCAEPVVGNNPFAVLLPDEMILQQPGVLEELVEVHHETGHGAIGVMPVPPEEISRYGIIQPGDANRIAGMVEKPSPSEAPSDLAIVGRYLFPEGFQACLRDLEPGAGGELQLTDAICNNLEQYPMNAVRITGRRFDTGNLDGYRSTWQAYLDDPDLFEQALGAGNI